MRSTALRPRFAKAHRRRRRGRQRRQPVAFLVSPVAHDRHGETPAPAHLEHVPVYLVGPMPGNSHDLVESRVPGAGDGTLDETDTPSSTSGLGLALERSRGPVPLASTTSRAGCMLGRPPSSQSCVERPCLAGANGTSCRSDSSLRSASRQRRPLAHMTVEVADVAMAALRRGNRHSRRPRHIGRVIAELVGKARPPPRRPRRSRSGIEDAICSRRSPHSTPSQGVLQPPTGPGSPWVRYMSLTLASNTRSELVSRGVRARS